MKKFGEYLTKKNLIGAGIILVIILACIYFFGKNELPVSFTLKGDTRENTIPEMIMSLNGATEGKAEVDCEVKTGTTFECEGEYVASSIYKLIKYQNKLFEIAEQNDLELNSIAEGNWIARMWD